MSKFYIFKDSLVVHVDGYTHVIPKHDARYEQIKTLIELNQLDDLKVLSKDKAKSDVKKLLGL